MVKEASRTGPGPREELSSSIKLRNTLKSRRGTFNRQEGYRHVKLKDTWRKPKGRHSKLRKMEKARGSLPGAGYGSPRDVRGLNRLGYRDVRVSTPRDLETLNSKEEMAVLAATLGKKKRDEMIKLAADKGIHISNA